MVRTARQCPRCPPSTHHSAPLRPPIPPLYLPRQSPKLELPRVQSRIHTHGQTTERGTARKTQKGVCTCRKGAQPYHHWPCFSFPFSFNIFFFEKFLEKEGGREVVWLAEHIPPFHFFQQFHILQWGRQCVRGTVLEVFLGGGARDALRWAISHTSFWYLHNGPECGIRVSWAQSAHRLGTIEGGYDDLSYRQRINIRT